MSPEELAALATAIQNNTLTGRQRRAVADLVHLVGTFHRQGAHTDTRAAYAFGHVVDVFEQLAPCGPALVADDAEAGSPEWHSLHHAGEGQHHECEYDVCLEWSARRALASASREGYWDERRQAGAR